MSGHAGVRSTSRRNTPQIPPQARNAGGPERNTRTLRSQSRDASGGESAILDARPSTRIVSRVRGSGRGGRRTKQAVRSGPQYDLFVVDEELNNAAIDQEENLDTVAARRSLSAISGTTARTSHSAQELADLRADDMLDALPDLVDASDKILKVALLHKVAEVSQERVEARIRTLQNSNSTASNSLSRQLPGYREQKSVYGNEQYVNLSIALRAMLGVRRPAEVGDGPWRVDDVFHKANLANLVVDVLSLRANVKQPFLEKMERDFPAPFMSQLSKLRQSSGIAGVSLLMKETFEAAFSLRVQLFLSMVNQYIYQSNFDPDNILLHIFYDDGKEIIKGWDIDGLRTADLSTQQKKEIVKRLESIRSHFGQEPSSEQLVDLQALESKYPWSECVMKLLLWARQRVDEIEAHLAALGGVDCLQEAIKAEMQNRRYIGAKLAEEVGGDVILDYTPSEVSHRPSAQIEPRDTTTGMTRKAAGASFEYSTPAVTMKVKEVIASAKQARQRDGVQELLLKSMTTTNSPSSERSRTTRSNDLQAPATVSTQVLEGAVDRGSAEDYYQPVVDDEPHVQSVPDVPSTERRRRILQTYRETLAEQDKENRPQNGSASNSPQKTRLFNERQSDAQKVSFESQISSQPGPSALRRKRAQVDDEYEADDGHMPDPSQDDGFQTQEVPPHVLRRNQATGTRRPPYAAASRPPPKKVRLNYERERSATLETDVQAAVNEANAQPPPSQIEIYNVARTQSKIATAQHVPKRTQRRTPWSNEETETLHNLIETYGVSWSLLKSKDADKVLAERDQVALKDKARNMYIDYLKSGIPIPPNFQNIPLKQADKIKLRDNHNIDLFALEDNDDDED